MKDTKVCPMLKHIKADDEFGNAAEMFLCSLDSKKEEFTEARCRLSSFSDKHIPEEHCTNNPYNFRKNKIEPLMNIPEFIEKIAMEQVKKMKPTFCFEMIRDLIKVREGELVKALTTAEHLEATIKDFDGRKYHIIIKPIKE